MWTNRKMEYDVLNFNDEAKCLHVVVQGTHKLVMMGHINCNDQVLIKRQRENKKMNVACKMFKEEEKNVIVKSCFHFLLQVVSVFEVLEFIAT